MMPHQTPAPKVSVSIITYNHKQFIVRTLESVLAQKRNFEIEIIIGDDCSTDGTQDILKRYQQKYPELIHLILHPKHNAGIPGRTNNITNIYACRGKYVALLDGDDYWTDDDKLQSQVDFLDGDDLHSVIGHGAIRVTPSGEARGMYMKYGNSEEKAGSYSLDDILRFGSCFVQTSTLMFRNKLFAEFPEWFWKIVSADFVLLLLLARHGQLKYVTRPMTAYTVHRNSFMANHYYSREYMSLKINELRMLKTIFVSGEGSKSADIRRDRSKSINTMIASYKHNYSRSLYREKGYISSVNYLFKNIFSDASLVFFTRAALKRFRRALQ